MPPNPSTVRIINRRRYTVRTAVTIATNELTGGGRGNPQTGFTWLMKTPRNNYFVVSEEAPNQDPTVNALPVDAAINLYGTLPNQILPFEQAFPGYTVEDA